MGVGGAGGGDGGGDGVGAGGADPYPPSSSLSPPIN